MGEVAKPNVAIGTLPMDGGEVAKLNVAIGTLTMDGPAIHLTPRDVLSRDGSPSSSDNDNPSNDDERAVTTTTPMHTPIHGRRLSHAEV